MCGRYVIASDPTSYADYFGVESVKTEALETNYNVAPTDPVYAVAEHDGERLLGRFRWGLIPHWAKDSKGIHINARAETVATKPLFRDSFRRKRCILPADGFYEWEPKDRGRLPHFVYLADKRPMGFAGIWSSWKNPDDGEWIRTCAIVTTTANAAISRIHSRMPVVLRPGHWDAWLDRSNLDVSELETFLLPLPAADTREHPVSTLVNNVRNNLVENIEPLPPPPNGTDR
ncbi:MAG: SOS response-associated peptidase [Acidimicrobiia bacterium]|nr:SOS response-associated peptidase [Acidimicrobiia bacterium]